MRSLLAIFIRWAVSHHVLDKEKYNNICTGQYLIFVVTEPFIDRKAKHLRTWCLRYGWYFCNHYFDKLLFSSHSNCNPFFSVELIIVCDIVWIMETWFHIYLCTTNLVKSALMSNRLPLSIPFCFQKNVSNGLQASCFNISYTNMFEKNKFGFLEKQLVLI